MRGMRSMRSMQIFNFHLPLFYPTRPLLICAKVKSNHTGNAKYAWYEEYAKYAWYEEYVKYADLLLAFAT